MYGITTVILFLIAVHGSVHAQSVSLVFSRPTKSNQVTLTCRDGSFQQLTTANFWLNSSLLTSLLSPSEYTVLANGMIRFTIRWDLEGFYSCGRSTRESNTLELVAIPPLENVQTYYLRRVGHMVTFACGIKPGVLRSRYNVVWSNDVNCLISTTFQNVRPRYELHLENFSLTIHQLQLNDQGNQYRCDVIVDNPQSTADFYSSGPYISLAVYEPPSIISEPQDRVIIHGTNDSVTYTCVARGAPVVSITWTFNGQDIVQWEDRARFPVSTVAVATINGASVLMSTLRIDQIQLQDSGVYECHAHITVNTGEREETISNTTTATLSVLTDNFVLAVGISTRGDLLLRLQLLTEIPEPLSLVLLFTNVDTGATSERTIHDNSFTNALEINSQVDNSQLPTFQAFTVQVAMMVRGLRGPFNQPGTVLRIDMAVPLPPNNITTTTQSECLSEQTIIIIVSAVAGSAVAIVLLFLCTFFFYKIIRMSYTARLRKDILAQVKESTDEQLRRDLLKCLQNRKVDSGDAASENGTEKEEEEETTFEPAVDAIVSQNKNMDKSKSNSPHSPPNYVGSTAVNIAGMESIVQELQLQSLVTNTGQSRLAIQGVPDLVTDKVPCNPPTHTNTDNAVSGEGTTGETRHSQSVERGTASIPVTTAQAPAQEPVPLSSGQQPGVETLTTEQPTVGGKGTTEETRHCQNGTPDPEVRIGEHSMSGKRTPEYIKFQKNYATLSRTLAKHLSPDELANELFAAQLFVEDLKSQANYACLDKTVRINDLLSAVHNQIELNPGVYQKFIEILEGYSESEELLKLLNLKQAVEVRTTSDGGSDDEDEVDYAAADRGSDDNFPHAITTVQNSAQDQQSVSGQQPEEKMLMVGVEGTMGDSIHTQKGSLPNYDAIGSSAYPPPYIDTHSQTLARGIALPDEHETGLDHDFCTNPSCPCQVERIRHLDKFMFGSQSKLGNQHGTVEKSTVSPLLELETVNYADPPNSNVHFMDDIEVLHCDSNGGRYCNSVHNIHVEVPKGAIPEGMLVKLEVGVALFGAFLFPAGMKAVSPILWLCTQPKEFMFNLPIEIKLPHCLQLTNLVDIASLQLGFLKGGHNSDDNGNIPFRYSDQATFQPHSSYGIIRTKHFCYLCLTAKSPQFCSKALFYLIRVMPKPICSRTWDINFCVVMFLNTCYKAVKNQYDASYHVAAPVQFKFNSPEDGHADPLNSICIKFEQYPTGGWILSKNTGQLLLRDVVDFERDLETMKTMHELKMYPPRFTIEVHGEGATAASCVEVQFTGVDRNLNTEVALPLPVPGPIQPPILQKTTETPMVVPNEVNQQSPTDPTPAAALNNEPELTHLMDKVAAKIPDQWRDVGIGLGLTVHELDCLSSRGLKPKDCFYYIFTFWKEQMTEPYSWEKIIQVLNSDSVGQKRLAADLNTALRASARHTYRNTSDGSTPRASESSDGSYSPQHYNVFRESTV